MYCNCNISVLWTDYSVLRSAIFSVSYYITSMLTHILVYYECLFFSQSQRGQCVLFIYIYIYIYLLLNLRSPRDCGSCRRAVRACGTSLVRWMALQCAKRTARRLVYIT